MIIHEPLGIEHPYEQQPQERFPRRPVAGETVTLGAVAAPGTKPERVWAVWTVEGEEEWHTAVALPQDTGWQVELPPFAAGQKVTYRLAGQQAGEVVETAEFTFEVPGWQPSARVERLERLADGLAVHFAFDDSHRPPLSWQIRVDSGDHVMLHVTAPDAVPHDEGGSDHLHFALDGVELDIQAAPFRLEIGRAGTQLLLLQSLPEWLLGPGQEPQAVRLTFDSPANEGFYGFGERFNALNQRGTQLDTLVFEQYKNQGKRTYIPMPWFLSSRGYGFYAETAGRVRFDLAAMDNAAWSAVLPLDRALTVHLFTGAGPLSHVQSFNRLTGPAEQPPDWIFGPWMSGNEWNTQAEVMRQVALSAEHDIPATVLVIEAWSDEATFYIWNGADYTPRVDDQPLRYDDFSFSPTGPWPDPKGMIDELHRRGIKLVLWQIPVLKQMDDAHAQHDLDRAMALERGYCLRNEDGTPYHVRPIWFHDSLLLDPSNPEARSWWLDKRAYLLDDLGVDGFKTDGGEHLWSSDVVMHNGARGDAAMNLYPNLYISMYHDLMRARGLEPLTFSRAGFVGAQSVPCHWAGDENSTWPAFRATVLAGLNAGLSGIAFWGWDIGGFSGEIPDAELYLRGTAVAAFCPIMQYHSELNNHRKPSRDRTPWNIAERTGRPEVIDIYRHFAKLRLRLQPYLQAEAGHCVANGEPMMRPLFLDWPDEPQAWQIDDQYMLGRSLLVAPVLEPGATRRRLFLPPGDWLDFWTEEPVSGGQWIDMATPLDHIPVFRRAGGAWPTVSARDSAAAS